MKGFKILVEEGAGYFAINIELPDCNVMRFHFDQEESVCEKLVEVFYNLGIDAEYEVEE